MLTAVGTFAGVGFHAFSQGIKGQKIPVPALAEGADLNLSAFSDGRMLTAVGTFAAVGFHAFSGGIKGQKIPVPALAEGADLNLSASRWEPILA